MRFKNCVLKYWHVASTINVNVQEHLHARHTTIKTTIIIINGSWNVWGSLTCTYICLIKELVSCRSQILNLANIRFRHFRSVKLPYCKIITTAYKTRRLPYLHSQLPESKSSVHRLKYFDGKIIVTFRENCNWKYRKGHCGLQSTS